MEGWAGVDDLMGGRWVLVVDDPKRRTVEKDWVPEFELSEADSAPAAEADARHGPTSSQGSAAVTSLESAAAAAEGAWESLRRVGGAGGADGGDSLPLSQPGAPTDGPGAQAVQFAVALVEAEALGSRGWRRVAAALRRSGCLHWSDAALLLATREALLRAESLAQAELLLACLLLPRVAALSAPPSRLLYRCITAAGRTHPQALANAVVLPALGAMEAAAGPAGPVLRLAAAKEEGEGAPPPLHLGKSAQTALASQLAQEPWAGPMCEAVVRCCSASPLAHASSSSSSSGAAWTTPQAMAPWPEHLVQALLVVVQRAERLSRPALEALARGGAASAAGLQGQRRALGKVGGVLLAAIKRFGHTLSSDAEQSMRAALKQCPALVARPALRQLDRLAAAGGGGTDS